jgi:hypothetical protein
MDDRRFDALVRTLTVESTRRRAMQVIGGAAAASLVRLGWEDIEASQKRKRNRRKRKRRCHRQGRGCTTDEGCCSGLCCPPWIFGEEARSSCAPKGDSSCCTVEQGGGYCCCGFPLCCGDPQRERETICELAGGECCNDEFGGSCSPGLSCCSDPEEGYCCPNGAANVAAAARQPRNYRSRSGLTVF